MKRSKTVVLNEPLNVGGKTIAEVVVRASTVGDEEDAMQLAVDMKRGTNPVTVEVSLLSIVTRLPYDAIRGMRGADYGKLRDALNALNGTGNGSWDVAAGLAELRRGMVALGKISQWSRSELRAMTPEEFGAYIEAAEAVEKMSHGA